MPQDRYAAIRALTKKDRKEIYEYAIRRSDAIKAGREDEEALYPLDDEDYYERDPS